jgi:hypothetical protein
LHWACYYSDVNTINFYICLEKKLHLEDQLKNSNSTVEASNQDKNKSLNKSLESEGKKVENSSIKVNDDKKST